MVSKAEKRARAQAKLEQQGKGGPTAESKANAPADTAKAMSGDAKVVTKVVGNLQVKMEGVSLRGARAAWYTVLQAHNGKPAQTYLEETAKTPPSLPKSGRAENPSGWLRWFVRNGIATIVQPQTQA
jgi:hypothetical protein